MANSIGLVNTNAFTEAANHFRRYGRYDDGVPDTIQHRQYWNQELKRCQEGYETGGVYISGYYYHYLNYSRIIKTKETFKEIHGDKVKFSKRVGKREEDFPNFWDVDFAYFTSVDIAENGISLEDYKKLPITLNINSASLAGGHHLLWLKPRGVGAPQPHSEVVITPNGESTIGDIKIGDFVFDRQGKPSKVIDKYPKGLKEVWEVELLDGRTVRCGNNHIWSVEYHNRGRKDFTTEQMYNNGLSWEHSTRQQTYKYKLPKVEPVKYEKKDLPIDPYILGALLGDGDTYSKSIRIANDDLELIERFKDTLGSAYELIEDKSNNNYLIKFLDNHNKEIKEKYSISPKADRGRVNPLKRELFKLGLRVKCKDKFIPEIYKRGSVKQRVDLVKGLMDTDGSISEKGYCEFTNTSLRLIEDLAYVIRSLGLYCSYSFSNRNREQSITDRGNKTTTFTETGYWRLFIATNKNIFHISRKANRINTKKKTKYEVPIVSIRKTGIFEEQSCLSVDNNEHLYLTRDFIPTHNSWKAASMACRNYACLRNTFTYMLANDKTFLEGDGLFSKFLVLRDWQIAENPNTMGINAPGIGKLAEKKNDLGGMQVRSGVIEDGKEIGFKSEVQGVALAGDEQKARGKRGKLILWEEFGKFPKVDLAWEIARPSVEELDIVYGLMLGFGTGGTKDANFEGLKKMFYNPLLYNLLFFDNVYSENVKEGDVCAMFTQAYKSIAYIDKDGNSDEIKAKEVIDEVRLQAEQNVIDPTLAPRKKAENPYTPEEAVLVTGKNIFISKGLEDHTKEVEIKEIYRHFPTIGKFEKDGFDMKFVVDNSLIPIWTFPHKPSDDLDGAVLMYQAPYRKNGKIPDNLYKICVDTYRHADTTGDSIGSIYVIEQSNNFTPTKGDIIAACYNGRPKGADGQEKFNQILFELAEYYNAEIAFENDEPGDVIGYAKRKRKTHMLAEEFELAYDENLKSSNGTTRGFGMKMASGRDDKRKKQGDLYIKYWLYTLRYTTALGQDIYNYHTIKDLGLLKELMNYGEGNFDRISALRVGMYHQQEMMYNEQVPRDVTKQDSVSRFFEKALF